MKKITPFHVLLKTLQQARVEGIWVPANYSWYKWNRRFECMQAVTRGSAGRLFDVGAFTLAEETMGDNGVKRETLNLQEVAEGRLFPSRRVNELELGDLLAGLGFPGSEAIPGGKSREQMKAVHPF